MARVLFINGFNRSGTTLLTTAATEAAGAATLTVGHLARHLPKLDEFLTDCREKGIVPDRGVDRLPVSDSMPEEYGWLLAATTGRFSFSDKAAESGILQTVVDEIAKDSDAQVVVLKNPWDTTQEQVLLDSFPDSQMLLVRRQISAIEDSLERAWARMATSHDYVRSLIADPDFADAIMGVILDPEARDKMLRDTKQKMRSDARELAGSVSKLPLDRVAFISYDELRDNPRAGAAWAAHLLDPDALGQAISAHTFPEYNRTRPSDWSARAVDYTWARAWRRARAMQVKAGILTRAKGR